jgi:hypothetical protein
MPEKRDSYQLANQSASQGAVQEVPTQQSVDLLIRLLQEFERRQAPPDTRLPPEVQRDVDDVAAALESLESALALGESPIVISSVTPARGPRSGGTKVTIAGSKLLQGATVRFGDAAATDVSVISPTEIQATTPAGSADVVDVVVNTLAGSASLARGYTYQS